MENQITSTLCILSMVQTVLFDLGNTLISYYTREQFPDILREAIMNCVNQLESTESLNVTMKQVWERVKEQNHGSPGNKVYPMEDRLNYIFEIQETAALGTLCDRFMAPIFRTSQLHDDVIPVLKELKRMGLQIGIISNTPWGCPARLWGLELERYGFSEFIDETVFCVDVGWRKPDPRIFRYALDKMNAEPVDCLFVGDDPKWDIAGPKAYGMKTLLIDRWDNDPDAATGLHEVIEAIAENDLKKT